MKLALVIKTLILTMLCSSFVYAQGTTIDLSKLNDPVDLIEYNQICGPAGEKSLTPDCISLRARNGKGLCKSFQGAVDSLEKFIEVCSESGYEDVECIKRAAACANKSEGEEGDLTDMNEVNKTLGLPEEDASSQHLNTCSTYGRKDYNARKSELGKDLREAQKDLEAAQKDTAKTAEEYSKMKRQQVERMSRVQEQMSKMIDDNQKQAQERSRQMSQDLIDIEKNQATARTTNLQVQGQIAGVLAKRAGELARLSDAMIKSNCSQQVDLILRKWAAEGPRSLNSSALLFKNTSEKKRRIKDEYQACIATANAARKATRKAYASEVQSYKEQMKGNDQQIASMESQKSQQQQDYQAYMARLKMSETEAFNRANAEVAAINRENSEVEQIRASRSMEVSKDIESARKRMNDLTQEMNNLGKEPRGDKTPKDAIGHFKKFMSTVNSFEYMAECKPLRSELIKRAKNEVIDAYGKASMSATPAAAAGTTGGSKSGNP